MDWTDKNHLQDDGLKGYLFSSSSNACEVQTCKCRLFCRSLSAVIFDIHQATTSRVSQNGSGFFEVAQTPRIEVTGQVARLC